MIPVSVLREAEMRQWQAPSIAQPENPAHRRP
jgi:hypothetical protein